MLNFEEWFERNSGKLYDNIVPYVALPDHLLIEVSQFFDFYLAKPNNIYENHPVMSKSLCANSYNELLDQLSKFRQKYKLMFLYEVGAIINGFDPIVYKIRFAVLDDD